MSSATPRLKNILPFAGLAPAASVVLVHGLNNGAKELSPDIIFMPFAKDQLVVTASTDISVTVQNISLVPLSGDVLVESWHTVERAFGGVQTTNLTPKPYIVYSDPGDAVPPPAIRNPLSPPEMWNATGIETSSSGTMNQLVGGIASNIQMVRAGSIVGIRVRANEPLTAGSITFTPTKNGVPVVGIACVFTLGDGASAIAAPGAVPYGAGDKIGFVYQANNQLNPAPNDFEAWLEVYEEI